MWQAFPFPFPNRVFSFVPDDVSFFLAVKLAACLKALFTKVDTVNLLV